MQAAQHRALACDKQATTGVAIQAMHQFQGLLGPRCAQRFNNASTDSAAPMHCDASRLVHHQQALILMQDGGLDLLSTRGHRLDEVAVGLRSGGHRQ